MINFKIIVPAFNVESWAEKNINSILSQEYKNFEIFYTDDLSTDNTFDVVSSLNDGRIDLVRNTQKKYALQNIVESIDRANPNDEDIIVLVDGDDWLYNDQALNIVKDTYEKKDVLLTYGSFMIPTSNKKYLLSGYKEEEIKNKLYRKLTWRASHLRTFKYKLWKNIDNKDLRVSDGRYFRMAADLATMFPMLEMSGGRFCPIHEILYSYNTDNPLNDHKVSSKLQSLTDQYIRAKPVYETLF